MGKFGEQPDQRLGLRLSLDLRLQRAAVRGLGDDKGAVVMLDPTTGEVLALASTPVFDAQAIADPDTSTADLRRAPRRRRPAAAARARRSGATCPGSVFKIVTGIAGLDSGAVDPETTFEEQPAAEETGLVVDGFRIRDGHHPQTGDTALDLVGATEASCNIWYALAGLETGGDRLVDEAAELGFGAPIPFDLPTAVSQVTSGDGTAPGGFADDAELASASFGQGETFVTPLQMALVAATVANDGVLMKPRVVTALTGDGPGATDDRPREPGAASWTRRTRGRSRTRCSRPSRATLGREFTAGAKVPGVPTAGKSGTAELGGRGRAPLVVHRVRARSRSRGSRSPCWSSAAGGAGSGRRPSPAT